MKVTSHQALFNMTAFELANKTTAPPHLAVLLLHCLPLDWPAPSCVCVVWVRSGGASWGEVGVVLYTRFLLVARTCAHTSSPTDAKA